MSGNEKQVSDQTVGQIFALTMILELADDEQWRARALKCLDDLMGYIVKNDLYIIDVDGEPTLWGKWNPDYVNKFPVNVGDRRINSSNIIAFLQTAYKFTGKEIYKNKALELIEKHGYLENQDLQTKFQASIKDHWEVERPEKNALWNFIYAMTGAKEFDLDQSVWFLKTYPLDLRNWGMNNSHRKDIERLPVNFRGQTYAIGCWSTAGIHGFCLIGWGDI